MSSEAVESWFAAAPQDQQSILRQVRELVRSLGPNVVEEFKWGRPCYSGPNGLFSYLQSMKNHAALGFYRGASLSDAHGLLEGTGKEMRHIKLREATLSNPDAVMDLLKQAWNA